MLVLTNKEMPVRVPASASALKDKRETANPPTGRVLAIEVAGTGPAMASVEMVKDVWLSRTPALGNTSPKTVGIKALTCRPAATLLRTRMVMPMPYGAVTAADGDGMVPFSSKTRCATAEEKTPDGKITDLTMLPPSNVKSGSIKDTLSPG
jgi:hypothetical protein